MLDQTDISLAPPIASATFHRQGPWLTAAIAGELDLASTPGVASAINAQIAPGDERLRIDLTDVTFCDSSGVAMLYRLRNRSLDEGFDFALILPAGPVRRILELCDQSGALPIATDHPSTASANA